MDQKRPPQRTVLQNYINHGIAVGTSAATSSVRKASRRWRGSESNREAGRDLNKQWYWSACYAPSTSLYFDQNGKVRACCQNTDHLLGDVQISSLREIWEGEQTTSLRDALASDDLGHGCDFCKWQRVEAPDATQFSDTYDSHPAGLRRKPRWPDQLEFAVSNTCNLQCLMCNGDWSSAIRSQREHRPPLADPYPERFYEELIEFIPHLRDAKFAGGEPFLARPSLRIMDLLVEHAKPELVLGAVTNGTIFNDRVERILNSVVPWISVSVDGGTPEVYERIRVGASFGEVLANIDRFSSIVAERGAGMDLTHCLMTDNWETFPELLLLAEERRLDVSINTVRFPEKHSLYHLPPATLSEVVNTLRGRTSEVEKTMTGNRLAVWNEQLDALTSRAASSLWPEALGVAPDTLTSEESSSSVPVSLSKRYES